MRRRRRDPTERLVRALNRRPKASATTAYRLARDAIHQAEQAVARVAQLESTFGILVREYRSIVDASERRIRDQIAGERHVVEELTGTLRKAMHVPRDISSDPAEATAAAKLRNKRGRRARP